MADLFARVDDIGKSTTEVGQDAVDYLSRTPAPAVAVTPPLSLLPSVFQAVRKAAALPSAPLGYVLGKTVPVILTAQALPYMPISEWPNLPKMVLDPLTRA